MITTLTYIAIVCGGLLVLLLLLSIIGGIDADAELDTTDGDGGAGWIKGTLTFLSIGAWTARVILLADIDLYAAIIGGGVAGAIAVYIISLVVKFALTQEANVNFSRQEAVFQPGRVYLKIPAGGEGLVHVDIRGAQREFKARSADGRELPTGTPVLVTELAEDKVLLVTENNN